MKWCVVTLMAFVLLAGCGSRAQDPLLSAFKARVHSLGAPNTQAMSVSDQQAQIRAVIAQSGSKDALLMVTLERRGAVATMGWAGQAGQIATWMDGSGISVSLQGDVVVSTRGLGHDVMASDVTGTLAALRQGGGGPYDVARRVFSQTGKLQWQTASCRMVRQPRGFEEICRGGGSAPFANMYSGVANGASRQWLGPDLGYIEIERLQ